MTKDSALQLQLHHPFVAVIQHITSPLTSALCIFGVYKASHIPKMQTWLRAVWILRTSHNRTGQHRHHSQQAHHPHRTAPFDGHHRHYTTSALTPMLKPFQNSQTTTTPPRALSTLAFNPGLMSQGRPARPAPLLGAGALSTLGLKPLVTGSFLAGQQQQRRNMSGIPSGASDVVRQTLNDTAFFPASWYVTSPYTGEDIVWSSQLVEHLINFTHVDLGLPWWQGILSVTLLFRVLVLPLNLSLVRNTLRLRQIKPEMEALNEKMKDPNPEVKVAAADSLVKLLKEKKCHPMKNMITPFLFPPLFLSLFGAVYDISAHHPGATTGGVLWFPDLSAADPTLVLPVLSGLSWLATIEMAAGEHLPLKPWVLGAARLGAIAFIPVTMALPSGVFIFWLTSNAFACTRAYIARQPRVARALGVPKLHAPQPALPQV